MLLISDYGKGVCTSSMLQVIGERARAADVPILVDPARGRRWSNYGQVTLIKATRVEALRVAAEDIRPLAMARALADEHRCSVVVTYGRHGMVAAGREGGTWYVPAESTEVRDVCGAGDTVLATLCVALCKTGPLTLACDVALGAAAKQVSKLGVDVVQPSVHM
ncbi:MAG: hypothetical protein KatS3mg105_4982 [Gemmatales bacterium]|nr:MAG: hypothetical protein KatS3mg105_4982 [Gemmatales bacterium]